MTRRLLIAAVWIAFAALRLYDRLGRHKAQPDEMDASRVKHLLRQRAEAVALSLVTFGRSLTRV